MHGNIYKATRSAARGGHDQTMDKIRRLAVALNKINAPTAHSSDKNFNASEKAVFWAIMQISAKKPDTKLYPLGELNALLGFTKPNLSQTVNRLEDKKLVVREGSKSDRRVTFLRLTESGEKFIAERKKADADKLINVIKVIPEKEQDKFIDMLERFAEEYTR